MAENPRAPADFSSIDNSVQVLASGQVGGQEWRVLVPSRGSFNVICPRRTIHIVDIEGGCVRCQRGVKAGPAQAMADKNT